LSNGIFADVLEAFPGAGPESKSGPDAPPPPDGPARQIRIVEAPDGRTEVSWRDKEGHIHRRVFPTFAEAHEFATRLACRLEIDEWREDCARVAAQAGARL